MKVTQLRVAGHGAWRPLHVEHVDPQLNVFFGLPRTGKSTVAQLIGHLLYGKADYPWRRQFGLATPGVDGAIEVDSAYGEYTLRRHGDGEQHGRLSIASAAGAAVDSRTIRSLLYGVAPRLLAELYAADFAEPSRANLLIERRFCREFTAAISQQLGGDAIAPLVDDAPWRGPDYAHDRRGLDDLVRRRDDIVLRIEQQMAESRRESAAVERELREVDAALAERRARAEEIESRLRGVEAQLAEIDAKLRYISLESAVRQGPAGDDEARQRQLDRLDAEIARVRQTLDDFQQRDATVRRELAEAHPDGTADSASALADQRATVGVLERLLNDLDAEVSQLARADEVSRPVGVDAHARLSPVAQLLRQQLYALCGQVTEQERTVRRAQLAAEARQLARSQSDLSEQLEHLLSRRQALVHEAQLVRRAVVALPQAPVARHCQCQRHDQFVRDDDAMSLAWANRPEHEDVTRIRRLELEREQTELRAKCDAALEEIRHLEARWEGLQRERADAPSTRMLDDLRASLTRLESEINRALSAAWTPAVIRTPAAAHRQPWRASDVLAQLTDGRLVQIRASREDRAPSVVNRDGRELPFESLAAAEQDQAHLALTLALVSSLAARGVDLPLVLDEPFLRQEPASAAAMAGVLAEFARHGRQMFVFTEDRAAVRRFESLGVRVRDLDELRRLEPLPTTIPAPSKRAVASVEESSPAVLHRIVREAVVEDRPRLRVAGHSVDVHDDDVCYLAADAPLSEFPILGADTGKHFAAIGLHTVEDLLRADAARVALRLDRPGVTPAAVRLWQAHTSLMAFVPGVSLADAQVLAANSVGTPAALMRASVSKLSRGIDEFFADDRGLAFAARRDRYTRDRLNEWKQRAGTEQKRWQKAGIQFNWVGSAAKRTDGKKVQTRTASRVRRSAAAIATNRPRRAKTRTLHFLLQLASPVANAPSITRQDAERLAGVGIRTVADLLNANAESTAHELAEPHTTAAVVARWQSEARLACRVPELRNLGARLLTAAGYAEPEQVADASEAELAKRIRAVCRSPLGKCILNGRKAPSRRRLAAWIRYATQRRPLEAA